MIDRAKAGIGSAAARWSSAARTSRQFNQVREFYGFCGEAALLHREVVQIAMLDGVEAVYLARHEGRSPIRLTAARQPFAGAAQRRRDAHCCRG